MILANVTQVEAADLAVGLFNDPCGSTVLRVPHGMTHLQPAEAFRLLYMAFSVFHRLPIADEYVEPMSGLLVGRAGRGGSTSAVSFIDAWGVEALFTHINPLHLLSVRSQTKHCIHGQLQRIERHLHHALFDSEDTAFFTRLPATRRQVEYGTADIVGMYFFLAEDFYRNLLQIDPAQAWGRFTADALHRSSDFRHRHLSPDDTLFGGDSRSQRLLQIRLQQLLRACQRQAAMRSPEYTSLHTALDRYLHPTVAHEKRQGQIWGMQNFWPLWESICLHEAVRQAASPGDTSIITCDPAHLPLYAGGHSSFAKWKKHQLAIFSHNDIERRPDLVLQQGNRFTVIDFKYYASPMSWPTRCTERMSKDLRLHRDLDNIELYGLLLHRHLTTTGVASPAVSLEFWIPGSCQERHTVVGAPGWNPPLTAVTMPMQEMISRYAAMHAPNWRMTVPAALPMAGPS